ncbi:MULTISPECIES: hypothetical protein [Pseudomonas]|uniref:DUF559 domain-containing protein n=1 Tax=Pseudomonas extremaustralis TaxID=359110 RepID=A0A5C5Q8P1_9PSED|nr:hypothetical protein [Pseudomonas extremaustralis]EZI27321.1 hypothetical protein PE143B_0117700 [Pseudomonas extremaustralis 14-3 substr. 14-3b]TWS02163.1 hypothetical protein FIV36_21495 [Pseudomonas extremaustralis]SDF66797.1 hypothetical protein SAMN05216591_3625 [Pseudomonas extremaustralis]
MPNETGDIENRPKELFTFPNYTQLPDEPFKIDLAGAVGEFLANDIFDLDGVQPSESAIYGLSNEFLDGVPVVRVNPSEEAIAFYKDRGDTFQMINVVVCCHSFERRDGALYGLPYHVSLRPAQKNGFPSEVSASWIEKIDLERILEGEPHYRGFNPFSNAFGLYAIGDIPRSDNVCSDVIGIVYRTYFIASKYQSKETSYPGMCTTLLEGNKGVIGDYRKYRLKNYFKKFVKVEPVKIWGCDSPIELFLLQAMSQIGLHPKIQMYIFPDGSTFPSLQSMWEGGVRTGKQHTNITEADFFFESEKVAVFCDSLAHHTSEAAIAKDAAIDEKLQAIGIRSFRVSGKDIAESPVSCATRLKEFLVSE